jgi:hypothetical protein
MLTSPEIMSEIESKPYSIVRLSSENIKDLAKLHSQVYATKIDEEYFSKKYNTAYTGVEHIGFLAYNKHNEVVAYYGVIPCFIKSGDELILAAQSTDTMTHPEHRYKGMFVELSTITFNLCVESGIRIVFGFPNENSYHGAVMKLGWQETEKMNLFTIAVNTLPLYSFFKKMKIEKLYKAYSEFVLKKTATSLHGIPNSVIKDGYAGVYRNEDYLRYKTFTPTKVLKIGESKIWISSKHNLLIGDMESVDENNFAEALQQLKSIARKSGIKKVQFLCCTGTSLNKLFESTFTPEKSFPVLFQNFGSPISLHKIKFTLADIDIF